VTVPRPPLVSGVEQPVPGQGSGGYLGSDVIAGTQGSASIITDQSCTSIQRTCGKLM